MPFTIVLLLVVGTLPLLSALLLQSLRTRHRWMMHSPLIVSEVLALVGLAWLGLMGTGSEDAVYGAYSVDWFVLGDAQMSVTLWLDDASLTVLMVLHLVSLMVAIFSTAYMKDDPAYRRYFTFLGMFVFSMHGLLLSDQLLLIYIFWELVGFCSYLLIGFWREQPAAYQAAKKAFLVNRIGDAGLMLALMALFFQFGTLSLHSMEASSTQGLWAWVAGTGILLAVMAKSAQIPLSVWLPDAMTGPTPVSALIHAATMVAAGVYLLIRTAHLLPVELLTASVWIGSITALMAGFSAIFQYDIKKILAYSTISQLGYMVAVIGMDRAAGTGLDAALFHLQTHAVFKAGLFLGAGAIIHLIHASGKRDGHHLDAQDIRLMGGFAVQMPWIAVAFLVCSLALMGLPLTAGFLSKEEILTLAWDWEGGKMPFVLLLTSVFTTALYTVRLLACVFGGKSRENALISLPKAEWSIRLPLAALAFGCLFFFYSPTPFDVHLLENVAHAWIPLASLGLMVLGGMAGVFFSKSILPSSALPTGLPGLAAGFFGLHGAFRSLGTGLVIASRWLLALDEKVVDGLVNAFAKSVAVLGFVSGWIDRQLVDGVVKSLVGAVQVSSLLVKSMHTGRVSLFFVLALTGIFALLWLIV